MRNGRGPPVRNQFDFSPVDILRPDLGTGPGAHPRFAAATPTVCDVGPGDVLFVPSYWWHEVFSRPDEQDGWNLAVNWWYAAVRPLPEGRLRLTARELEIAGAWPT